MALFEFFGRLHVVVLHVPLGLSVGLLAFETLAWLRREAVARRPKIVLDLAGINALAALVAMGTGLLLQRSGGYDETALDRHLAAGVVGSVLSVILWVLGIAKSGAVVRPDRHIDAFRVGTLVVFGLLALTGHLGGNLTHGEDFLWEPFKSKPARRTPSPAAASTTPEIDTAVISPVSQVMTVLERTCVSCHGPTKTKGDLAVHTFDDLFKGGESGPSVVSGDPDNSLLLTRILLPLEDDDHMPPKGKPQPNPAEIEILRQWILKGAPREDHTPTQPAPENQADEENSRAEPIPSVVRPDQQEALRVLREALVHVEELSSSDDRLRLGFEAVGFADNLKGEQVATLTAPVAHRIVELIVPRLKSDEAFALALGEMPQLQKLDLRGSDIAESHLEPLARHTTLEELNLVETRVGDNIVDLLATLPALRRVFLWNTKTSAEALHTLRRDHPELMVDSGEPPRAATVEKETEIQLSGDAPPPLATPPWSEPKGFFDSSKWTKVFDGASLKGWTTKGGRYDGNAVWTVENGAIVGREGENHAGGLIYTEHSWTNFVFSVDVFMTYPFDSGVFVRMVPPPGGKGAQVTLDFRDDGEVGAIYADGFLTHNKTGRDKFRKDAWNRVEVRVVGRDMTIEAWLNGEKLTEYTTPPGTPGYAASGLIGLQVHGGRNDPPGSHAAFRNMSILELPEFDPRQFSVNEQGGLTPTPAGKAIGWRPLFDGSTAAGWEFKGPPASFAIKDGEIHFIAERGAGGLIRTVEDYRDFEMVCDVAFSRMANSGIFLRADRKGDNPAFSGCEVQILDDFNWETVTTSKLKPWQFSGSLYGSVAPGNRQALKPLGRWNTFHISYVENELKTTLNGTELYRVNVLEVPTEVPDTPPFSKRAREGFIGFQHYSPEHAAPGTYLRLRNLFVRVIEGK